MASNVESPGKTRLFFAMTVWSGLVPGSPSLMSAWKTQGIFSMSRLVSLVGGWPTPLKNMSESQLGWWHSQYMENYKNSWDFDIPNMMGKSFFIPWFQTTTKPTNQQWFMISEIDPPTSGVPHHFRCLLEGKSRLILEGNRLIPGKSRCTCWSLEASTPTVFRASFATFLDRNLGEFLLPIDVMIWVGDDLQVDFW